MANNTIEKYFLQDDGIFPNSRLPVLYYPGILKLPGLFPAAFIKKLFYENGWSNAWKSGIYTFHHYHSNTHEVMGVYKGGTTVQLGGERGITLQLKKTDVLIIPAGVAHRNMEKEKSIKCVGAYPGGVQYDMKFGSGNDRPAADLTIENVPKPTADPVYGRKQIGLLTLWPDVTAPSRNAG